MSQKQTIIATSTCEAEYGAAFAAAKQITWLRFLLSDFGVAQVTATKLGIDNQGTIEVIQTPEGSHKRTKHWDIAYKFTQWKQRTGALKVHHVSSKDNIADIFTKPLTPVLFRQNVQQLNMG
jgi:hypothetical protein